MCIACLMSSYYCYETSWFSATNFTSNKCSSIISWMFSVKLIVWVYVGGFLSRCEGRWRNAEGWKRKRRGIYTMGVMISCGTFLVAKENRTTLFTFR